MLQEKRLNNERLNAAASEQTVQRSLSYGNLRILEMGREPKRGAGKKQSVRTNLFLHLVFAKKH
jgi:hypothetical protein